jgi:hypothetical protein
LLRIILAESVFVVDAVLFCQIIELILEQSGELSVQKRATLAVEWEPLYVTPYTIRGYQRL